jgi:hypothetical protein
MHLLVELDDGLAYLRVGGTVGRKIDLTDWQWFSGSRSTLLSALVWFADVYPDQVLQRTEYPGGLPPPEGASSHRALFYLPFSTSAGRPLVLRDLLDSTLTVGDPRPHHWTLTRLLFVHSIEHAAIRCIPPQPRQK